MQSNWEGTLLLKLCGIAVNSLLLMISPSGLGVYLSDKVSIL